MKFKPGDKVRLTNKYRYGEGSIESLGNSARKEIDKLADGIFTIKGEHSLHEGEPNTFYYYGEEFKGIKWAWKENFLELVKAIPTDSIDSRFEIIDL